MNKCALNYGWKCLIGRKCWLCYRPQKMYPNVQFVQVSNIECECSYSLSEQRKEVSLK